MAKKAQLENREVEEDDVAAKKRRKKEKKAIAAAAAEAELAAPEAGEDEAAPKKRKKRDRKAAAAEAATEEPVAAEEEDEVAAKKRRKKEKKAAAAAAAENDGEEEAATAPKKQKKTADSTAEAEATAAGENQNRCLFVGGIPWATVEDVLRKDFEECGEVEDVHIPRKEGGLSRGIAFVTMKDEAGVAGALKFDGQEYGGRTLQIYRAEARDKKGGGKGKDKGGKDADAGPSNENEVFIKGLAWLPLEKEEEAIRNKFKDCGKIIRLNMPVTPENRCKGFAWITFKTPAAVERALEMDGTSYDGRTISVEKSGLHKIGGKGKEKGKVGESGSSELEIFVKNLGFETREITLQKKFSECGEIERLKMPVVGEGKCMGFAWITFKTKEGLDAALALNDEDLAGRRMFIEQSGQHKGKGKDKGKGKGKDKGKGKGKDW